MASRRMVNNLRKAVAQSTSKSRRTTPSRQYRQADQGMSI